MLIILKSVHSYNYSDISYEILTTQKKINRRIAPKKITLDQKFSAVRPGSSRIVNRAFFEMRKTQLQVCQRAWPWPQALSIHKSPQKPTGDVLRAQRLLSTGSEVIGRICTSTRNIGRNQCNQYRTNPTAGGVLNDPICFFCRCQSYRCTASKCVGSTHEKWSISGGNQQ